MAFLNYGIGQIGSALRGLGTNVSFMGSLAFGTGGSGFNGSDTYLNFEVIRVPITWSAVGSDPRGTSTLSTAQANGSGIQELGMVFGASANGSDIFTRNLSAIGSKNNTFSVVVQQDIRIRRTA